MHYQRPAAILEKLKLEMKLAVQLEDPTDNSPIALAYENLHTLIVVDTENLVFEGQVIANLYAEMGRFQRAAEYAAAIAEAKYRSWKGQRSEELKAQRRTAKEKPPTAEAVESYYRDHADYEKMTSAAARYTAIAGLFEDLKYAFRMKSEVLRDQNRIVGGFERIENNADRLSTSSERMEDYAQVFEGSDAAQVARQLLGK